MAVQTISTINPLAMALMGQQQGESSTALADKLRLMQLEQLSQGVGDSSPVQHWAQGAARMGNGLLSGLMANKMIEQSKADDAAVAKTFSGLPNLSGGSAPAPAPQPAPAPAQPPGASPMGNVPGLEKSASIENQALARALAGKPTADQNTIPTPFGVNIPVKTSNTLPQGLSQRASSTFSPMVSAFSQKGLPVNITSAYRDPSHNARVGGARGSQHMGGNAIDMSLRGMTDEQKRQAVAIAQSQAGVNGFGYYPKSDSIHVDVRNGPRAAWGGNYRNSSVGQGWPDWLTQQTRGWQAGQAPQVAQQQQPQASQPVRMAALGGGSMPSPQRPSAPAQPQGQQVAQAQPGQTAQKPRSGLTPEQDAWYQQAIKNPRTRDTAVKMMQEWTKPREYKPHDAGDEIIFHDSQGNVVKREPKKLSTDDLRELAAENAHRRAKGMPELSPMDFITAVKRSGAMTNSVVIDQKAESAFSSKAAESQVKRYNEIVEAGFNAKAMRSDLDTLRDLRTRFETGKAAEIKSALGPYAAALGVKMDNLGDMQAYDAIIAKLAPRMRPAGSGATSDFEMQQYLKALPTLGKTPEGNAILDGTMQALEQHQGRAAEIASKALNGEIDRKQAEKELRDLPDPMSAWKEWRKKQGASDNAPVRRFNPATGKIE